MNHLIFNWGVKWSVHTRFIKCFFFSGVATEMCNNASGMQRTQRLFWKSELLEQVILGLAHTQITGMRFLGSWGQNKFPLMKPWSHVPHMYIWPLQRQLIHHVAFTLISLMLQFTGNAAASEYHPNVQLWVSSTCFVLEETQRAQNAGICLEGFLHFITHMRIRLRFLLCKRFSIISFWEGKV